VAISLPSLDGADSDRDAIGPWVNLEARSRRQIAQGL
jgi:hypothetical protein